MNETLADARKVDKTLKECARLLKCPVGEIQPRLEKLLADLEALSATLGR